MPFPIESVELSERTADTIREKHGGSKSALAEGLYHHLKGRFDYGFREGIVQGTFVRWPHEIKNEWECVEAAMYTYMVANALGLEPRMISVAEWQGISTGHETVDVLVDGQRFALDPLNHMFGPVSYAKDAILVEDNDLTETCRLECVPLEEICEDMIVKRMEHYRSDEGILSFLAAGQQVKSTHATSLFIRYCPKVQAFEYQSRLGWPFLEQEYATMTTFFDRNCIRRRVYEAGICFETDWVDLVDKEPLMRITFEGEGKPGECASKSKDELFYGGPRSQTYLMRNVLYDMLLKRKVGWTRRSKSCLLDQSVMFENPSDPMERLWDTLMELKRNLSPENKGRYFELRRAFIGIVEIEHAMEECGFPSRGMDVASFKKFCRELATEEGISELVLYSRALKRLGVEKPFRFGGDGMLSPPNFLKSEKELTGSIDEFMERICKAGYVR